jgi:hypothetical protein
MPNNERNTKQDIEIAEMKTDICWIKERVNHLGDNQKWIVRTVIVGTVMSITVTVMAAIILKFY